MSLWEKRKKLLAEVEEIQEQLKDLLHEIAKELEVAKGAKVFYNGQEWLVFDYSYFCPGSLWLTLTKPTKTGAMPARAISPAYTSSEDVSKVQ